MSPVVANIYMEMFEELALRTATHPPQIWRHTVDDTFCVITKTEVKGFLSHLNSLRCPVHVYNFKHSARGRVCVQTE